MKSINPYNNQLIKEYTPYSPAEVEKILVDVDREWQSWKKLTVKERATMMLKVSEVLLENKEKYAEMMALEMGKILKEARGEIEKCALLCRYYAESAEGILADRLVETDYSRSLIAHEPIGLVLAVMPWNFPFWQVIRFAVPCLVSGNGALLKHASNVQGCGLMVEEIFREAGLPENIFRTLVIPSKQVEAVITNPLVRAVMLTGSEPAGMSVASTAGKQLKKSVMELGGSDPFIVLEDADLDKAVEVSVTSRALNVGQVCIAAKRFIVVESVAEEFIRRHGERMAALVMGDPLDEKTQLAPMSRPEFVEDIHAQVEKSVAMGATLITGGKLTDSEGYFYPATVLSDVKKGMPVYDEETFGPVSAIITVKDEEEAIRIANDTDFGLGAAVWTQDKERGERVARQVDCGMVFVNTLVSSNPKLPFGGSKRSGYGRECSEYGLKEFTNIKTICVQ